MSDSQRTGIITCLPKGDKPRQFLKNWRPITLLNTVYKIAAGSIASRLKSVLNKLINNDQTGFIPGRYIGENTRLIYDILQYTEDNNIPGLLLLIDFEKAFDSIAWKFIQETLSFFNFGNSFRKWVEIFQRNIKSAINQGGNISEFFIISRGCRQGDPISPYIFILCAEIMAIKIRNNDRIKGINIEGEKFLISLFADDTSLILDGSYESLNSSLEDLYFFSKISGLRINYSKTQLVWIGSKKYSAEKLCSKWNLHWGNSSFNLLGVEFNVDLQKIIRMNYDKKLVKLKHILSKWKRRKLTPLGKITVIKTLLISQFNHLFIALPNPNDEFISNLNSILFSFLWDNKPDRVKRDIIIKTYREGGLKMIDIQSFIYSLKTAWIRRLITNANTCKYTKILESEIDTHLLFECGTDYLDICIKNITNSFWKDVFTAFKKLRIKNEQLTRSEESFLKMPLFYNKQIMIDNSTVFYKDWFEKGIRCINDLMNGNLVPIDFREFREKFNLDCNFLKFYGIASAINLVRKQYPQPTKTIELPTIPDSIQVLIKTKKGSKDMYRIFIKNETEPTGKKKWNKTFNFTDERWQNIFNNCFQITHNSKLLWLQYRINHYILPTNTLLFKIGIVQNNQCCFCKGDMETLEHLFWDCNLIQNLIGEFENYLIANNILIEFNKQNLIFGPLNTNEHKALNYIFLILRYYIYNTRCLQKN